MYKKMIISGVIALSIISNNTYANLDNTKKSILNTIPNGETLISQMDDIIDNFSQTNNLHDTEIYIYKIGQAENKIKSKNKKIYYILHYLKEKLQEIKEIKKENSNKNYIENNIKNKEIKNDSDLFKDALEKSLDENNKIITINISNIKTQKTKDFLIKETEKNIKKLKKFYNYSKGSDNQNIKEQAILIEKVITDSKDFLDNIYSIEIKNINNNVNINNNDSIKSKDGKVIKNSNNNEVNETNLFNDDIDTSKYKRDSKETIDSSNNDVIKKEQNTNIPDLYKKDTNNKDSIKEEISLTSTTEIKNEPEKNIFANINKYRQEYKNYYIKPVELEKIDSFESNFDIYHNYRDTKYIVERDGDLFLIKYKGYLNLDTNYNLIKSYKDGYEKEVIDVIKGNNGNILLKGKDYKNSRIAYSDDFVYTKLDKNILDHIKNIKDFEQLLLSDVYFDSNLMKNNNLYNYMKNIYNYSKSISGDYNILLTAYLKIINQTEYNYRDINKVTNHSGLTTFNLKTGVCDGYVKALQYILIFNGLENIEKISGDAYTLGTDNKTAHAWLKIGNLYFDPTFDDPLTIRNDNREELYNKEKQTKDDLMYFGLTYDIFSLDRYGNIPKGDIFINNVKKLLVKYPNNKLLNYIKNTFIN